MSFGLGGDSRLPARQNVGRCSCNPLTQSVRPDSLTPSGLRGNMCPVVLRRQRRLRGSSAILSVGARRERGLRASSMDAWAGLSSLILSGDRWMAGATCRLSIRGLGPQDVIALQYCEPIAAPFRWSSLLMQHRLGGLAWPCSGICSCASSTTPGDDLPRHVLSVWHRVGAGLMIFCDIEVSELLAIPLLHLITSPTCWSLVLALASALHVELRCARGGQKR